MAIHHEGDLKERKIVSRFRNSSKYNRIVSSAVGSFLLLGVVFLLPGIVTGSLEFSFEALGVFFLQVALTIAIANILIYHLIESPRRFLIEDAERELREFMDNSATTEDVLSALNSISASELSINLTTSWNNRSKIQFQTFQDLKSRHQVARAGSKLLAMKFWRSELVIINERKFLVELHDAAANGVGVNQLRSRLWRSLDSLSSVYCRQLGDLPTYPAPHKALETTQAIERFMGRSEA